MIIKTYKGIKNIEYTDDIKNADLITHTGTFHSDDVFSTVLLLNVIDKDIIYIHRTKDEIKKTKAIVYDIGSGAFDHHQVGENGKYKNGISYASFGLLWDYYGKEFLKEKTSNIDYVFNLFREKIIYNLDAVDNGLLETDNNYNINVMGIPEIIATFNNNWNEDYDQNKLFLEAVSTSSIIFNKIMKSIIGKSEAKVLVDEAIENSVDGLMELKEHVPWEDALFSSTNPKAKDILYVIYPDSRSAYALRAVPEKIGSFVLRKNLPKKWAGLKNEELANVTKVEDATFCHNSLFLCCADSYEGIKKLAKIALARK